MSRIIRLIRPEFPLDYAKFLTFQEQLVTSKLPLVRSENDALVNNKFVVKEDYLILAEHQPTYTAGRRVSDLDLANIRNLNTGADIYKTGRGGQWTWHGPGQLVLYPILNLENHTKSIKWYVCRLEETLIQACKALGLETERGSSAEEVGIWVKGTRRKIGFIGIQNSRWITSHGISLNVCNDRKWFDNITPCGLPNLHVTSLKDELLVKDDDFLINNAKSALLTAFGNVFESELEPYAINL